MREEANKIKGRKFSCKGRGGISNIGEKRGGLIYFVKHASLISVGQITDI